MSREWIIELLLWIITVIVAMLAILPMISTHIDFPFWGYNIIFGVLGLTFARYVLFWHLHPLRTKRGFMIGLIFLVPIIIFPIIDGFHSFVLYLDQVGLQELVGHLNVKKQGWMIDYMRIEYLIFAILTFAGGFMLIIKMVRELFRSYRR